MGAAKFPEEIVERFIESTPLRADDTESVQRKQFRRIKVRLPKYCPLCFESFLEEAALAEHVARKHGKQHVYLRVNDRIVRDVCWTRQSLTECTIVLVDSPAITLTIDINGAAKQLPIDRTTPLMKHLRAVRSGGVVKIAVEKPFSRTYSIFLGSQPQFEADRLDSSLFRLMERLIEPPRIDLVAFRDERERDQLSDLERRYLNGVLEYCHAWQLRSDGRNDLAKEGLERSLDLLIPFNTQLAIDLRCALALTMNCFGGQWACDADSPFRLTEAFFCRNSSARPETPGDGSPVSRIPIDSLSQYIIDAVSAYYANDAFKVFTILDRIKQDKLVKDRNDEDKLTLLDARTKKMMGNLRGAAMVYELIADHPLFGGEAAGFIASIPAGC